MPKINFMVIILSLEILMVNNGVNKVMLELLLQKTMEQTESVESLKKTIMEVLMNIDCIYFYIHLIIIY